MLASADLILILHFLFVLGVVLPVPLIALGAWRGWEWVRNRYFRRIHLAMIGIVVAEALIGILCPLTVWEQALRARAGEARYSGSFVEHWVSRLLYYDFPSWVFTCLYVGFGAIIMALYFAVPPKDK